MKKLLFIIPAFNHGGTNRSLMHILSYMDNSKYAIDIFSISDMGPYKKAFSSYNVLRRDLLLASFLGNYGEMKREMPFEKSKKIPIKIIYFLLRHFWEKRMLEFAYRKAANRIETLNYDTVIAMQEGSATRFASKIQLPKIAWIHCDYSKYLKSIRMDEEEIYSRFNHIICVSEYTRKVFANYYPSLGKNSHAIHNIIDDKAISQMSDDLSENDDKFQPGIFSIISIGRFSKVKQFHIIPEIAEWLNMKGCVFRWYIIGDGEEKDNIADMIKKWGVQSAVVLLGAKDNPYPYIKLSDMLVCTSISEACPHVINEAKILGVPVVTTNFGSAPEFIDNDNNGIIASKENLKTAIREMIMNKEKYSKIKEKLKSFEYPNKEIIQKLSEFL